MPAARKRPLADIAGEAKDLAGRLAALALDSEEETVRLRRSYLRRQLEQYFAGSRTTFDVPLELTGTVFEQRVWELLRRIPYGAATSYGELARRLGDPSPTPCP